MIPLRKETAERDETQFEDTHGERRISKRKKMDIRNNMIQII